MAIPQRRIRVAGWRRTRDHHRRNHRDD